MSHAPGAVYRSPPPKTVRPTYAYVLSSEYQCGSRKAGMRNATTRATPAAIPVKGGDVAAFSSSVPGESVIGESLPSRIPRPIELAPP